MGRRQFGTVRTLPSGRVQARYRDGKGYRHSEMFRTKADANRWLSEMETELARGTWVDPKAGEVLFRLYAERWVAERPLAIRTRELYEDLLRLHIVKTFGPLSLIRITPESVRRWHSAMLRTGRPPAVTTAKCYRLLRAILNTAVEDGRLGRNPCMIKGAGRERSAERPVASLEQVYQLADAVRPRWRLLVLLATFTSLRQGEALGLRRRDVLLDQAELRVVEQLQELRSGEQVRSDPKADSRRTVSIPSALVPEVKAHLREWVEPGADALVFTGVKGGPLRRSFFGVEWRKVVADLGMEGFHFHDLRHTGNTLAAGVPGTTTKDLMARMGHRSSRAAMIYQHATKDRDRAIAEGLSKLVEGFGDRER